MRKEWHSVIEKIEQHKFYEALVLGLPLFESALRRVYVVENNCASRILTAENSQLFCTLDTILDPYADDKELNKLFAAFPPNANVIFFEIFIWKSSIRIFAICWLMDTLIQGNYLSHMRQIFFHFLWCYVQNLAIVLYNPRPYKACVLNGSINFNLSTI
jgi:hypothetical protein